MNSSSDEPKAEAITVLLVEDDAPTLWRLQDALAKAGYQVRAAGTLTDARASLAEGAPRVLLTDLQLPDGHGVDLIRETRAATSHEDGGTAHQRNCRTLSDAMNMAWTTSATWTSFRAF
jgi:DNA-binding NtrC family response regulator